MLGYTNWVIRPVSIYMKISKLQILQNTCKDRQGKTITLQWVLSHVGIHGNGTADLLAKKAPHFKTKNPTQL